MFCDRRIPADMWLPLIGVDAWWQYMIMIKSSCITLRNINCRKMMESATYYFHDTIQSKWKNIHVPLGMVYIVCPEKWTIQIYRDTTRSETAIKIEYASEVVSSELPIIRIRYHTNVTFNGEISLVYTSHFQTLHFIMKFIAFLKQRPIILTLILCYYGLILIHRI